MSREDASSTLRGDPLEFARLNLIGEAPVFMRALSLIRRLAACEATVLITGETGTGKELAARALHYLGPRENGPFVPVNCGALPDALVESELFGHVRGAFTDAREAGAGLVAHSEGGTLFLDEVEALSLKAQVVLLRFLQDKEYRPVGGRAARPARVRVLAASNIVLDHLVGSGGFRADLLFRLSVVSIEMPPLRERPGDAALLATHFMGQLNRTNGGPSKRLDPASFALLASYAWPGNVRELENVVQRQWLLSDGDLVTLKAPASAPAGSVPGSAGNLRQAKARALAEFEREYVARVLAEARGSITLAARLAGKERSAFGKLVKKYQLRAGQG